MSKKNDMINIINYKSAFITKNISSLNIALHNNKKNISSLKSNIRDLENLYLLSCLPRVSNEISSTIERLNSQRSIILGQISDNKKQMLKLNATLEALKETK